MSGVIRVADERLYDVRERKPDDESATAVMTRLPRRRNCLKSFMERKPKPFAGHTSTTTVNPARRIAGAAAARSAAARDASARGRSGLADELRGRWRFRSRSSGAGPSRSKSASPALENLLERTHRVGVVGARDDDADKVAERRVAERLAACELAREEAADVVARRVLHSAGVRLERLDDDAARRVPPAAAR